MDGDGGTYIRSAYIQDAVITNLITAEHISDTIIAGNVTFGSAQIADGVINNAKIADVLQSTNYQTGLGWRLQKDGGATFKYLTAEDGTFKGVLEASVIKGGMLVIDPNETRYGATVVGDRWTELVETGAIETAGRYLTLYFPPNPTDGLEEYTIVNPYNKILDFRCHCLCNSDQVSSNPRVAIWIRFQNLDGSYTAWSRDLNNDMWLTNSYAWPSSGGGGHVYIWEGSVRLFGTSGTNSILTNVDLYNYRRVQVSLRDWDDPDLVVAYRSMTMQMSYRNN